MFLRSVTLAGVLALLVSGGAMAATLPFEDLDVSEAGYLASKVGKQRV